MLKILIATLLIRTKPRNLWSFNVSTLKCLPGNKSDLKKLENSVIILNLILVSVAQTTMKPLEENVVQSLVFTILFLKDM